jgi:hypothetical protein
MFIIIGTVNGQGFDIPTIKTDVMSHFQSEMPSLLECYRYFYFNGIFAAIGENKLNPDSSGTIVEMETMQSLVLGGIIGGKIPINSMFSITGFSTLLIGSTSHSGAGETFTGAGLQIDHDLWGGGVFAGAYYRGSDEDTGNTLPFRMAITSSVKTSQLGTVGTVLDKVMGFIGMGEAVSVAGEEDKDTALDWIVRGLNWGLDIAFTRIDISSAGINLTALYRRDNYAVGAKTDTFGLVLGFMMGKFDARAEAGYKSFYAVERLLKDIYFDTGYIDITAGYQFSDNFSVGIIYKYDDITLSRFGLIINLFKQIAVAYRGEQDIFFSTRLGY